MFWMYAAHRFGAMWEPVRITSTDAFVMRCNVRGRIDTHFRRVCGTGSVSIIEIMRTRAFGCKWSAASSAPQNFERFLRGCRTSGTKGKGGRSFMGAPLIELTEVSSPAV